MRLTNLLTLSILAAASVSALVWAQSPDDDLTVFGVNVMKAPPLKNPFTGYGIYLGDGKVITAAHVVGDWPAASRPHVVIAGLELAADVLKIGSLDTTDLALLSIDAARLPLSLQLRRNSLCKTRPAYGAEAVVIYPQRAVHTTILSPMFVEVQNRARYGFLVSEQQSSGSGVFDAEQRCLLGIISRKIQKYDFQKKTASDTVAGFAGYYLPAWTIANFIPRELRLRLSRP